MSRAVMIGEAMMELRPRKSDNGEDGDGYDSDVAGDVYNTAVYLKRLMGADAEVCFLSALGDEQVSQAMRSAIEAEGIDTSLTRALPGAVPGLYMIHTDDQGERSFTYWRSTSAARRMLEGETADSLAETLSSFDVVYFSGITLAILPPEHVYLLIEAAARARANGALIAFDPNYRAKLWPGVEAARAAYERTYSVCDILLPGMDDEMELHGDTASASVLDRLRPFDIGHVVLKAGSEGVYMMSGGQTQQIPYERVTRPVDTTAAGDSFAAGWLAGRLQGLDPAAAVEKAARVAAFVVTQPGAIARRAAFDAFLEKEKQT